MTADAGGGVRPVLDVPIRYDTSDGTIVHSAMIEATVGGVSTRLILDTGSTDHVLTMALVLDAGLPAEHSEPGTDHAGAPVPSWAVGDVEVVIGETRLDLGAVVAFEGPPPFAGWGIGGFLSPQHLHPSAWIVIDLAANRLVLVEADEAALDGWLDERYASFRRLTLTRAPGAATVNVQAALDPGDEVETILNTGGIATEFSTSVVGHETEIAVEQGGKGLSGAGVMGRRIGPRTIVVGGPDGARLPVADLTVRDGMVDPLAMIGSDVLRGTIVVCAADPGRAVRWLLPH